MLELMSNENVRNQMEGLTCCNETKHLDEFFETLRQFDNRAAYGYKSVKYAFDSNVGSIKTLLVSDHLFRSKNALTRKIYVDLAQRAENNGVKVIVFSSMNPTGERLK